MEYRLDFIYMAKSSWSDDIYISSGTKVAKNIHALDKDPGRTPNGITNTMKLINTALPDPVTTLFCVRKPCPMTEAEPQLNCTSEKMHHKNKRNILPMQNSTPLTLFHTAVLRVWDCKYIKEYFLTLVFLLLAQSTIQTLSYGTSGQWHFVCCSCS